MNIAVTAASGQMGQAIIKALCALMPNQQVIGLARTPAKAASLGVEIRPGDYNLREQLVESLKGVDVVLLVSGMAPPSERIAQHRNVIDAAKLNGVQKIVYTSIQGAEEGTAFSPVVQSNRQTEQDIRDSGMQWVIGRNGIYIEPDVEYIEQYKQRGEVANCAADGKCGYTTRPELAAAYAKMLIDPEHNGQTYNLHGQLLTQAALVEHLNRTFKTALTYRNMSVEAYRQDRTEALGDFLGPIIAGIYEGIRQGALDQPSDFQKACGRPHQDWANYFSGIDVG